MKPFFPNRQGLVLTTPVDLGSGKGEDCDEARYKHCQDDGIIYSSYQ